MPIYELYDNGGKTIDRYTLIADGAVYTLSENPLSPQGVNCYCCQEEEIQLNEDDVRIKLEDLPSEVRDAIWYRMHEKEVDNA